LYPSAKSLNGESILHNTTHLQSYSLQRMLAGETLKS